MRCIYGGRVSIPHSDYEMFRTKLMEIPAARRASKFRASLTDRWGARATVLYDAKSDEFYEKASKRKVVDRSAGVKDAVVVACSELGRASLSGDENLLHETMNKLQEQNRSGNHRSRHKKVRVPQKFPGGSSL